MKTRAELLTDLIEGKPGAEAKYRRQFEEQAERAIRAMLDENSVCKSCG